VVNSADCAGSGCERRSIGAGAHGERVYDWTAVTLDTDGLPDGWGRWEARLDYYQVRSYRAWHALITVAMLAAAYLAVTRATAHDREAEKGDLQPAAHG
jgi:hypothetical protein